MNFFSSIDNNGIYAENEGEAVGTFLAAFGGSRVDDTLRIVGSFMNRFYKRHITHKLYRGNNFDDPWGMYR